MSVEAITWALKQTVSKSSAKFVLVVLANCASSVTGEAYPSVKYLVGCTGQDRKTVLANLKQLAADGFIEDAGARAGRTGQVVVYRLRIPNTSTENGTLYFSRENSPVFPPKSPKNGAKQAQKRDTEPLGTVIKQSRGKKAEAQKPKALSPTAFAALMDEAKGLIRGATA